MKLGDLEFHILSDGTFLLDGGAMFGVIPRPLWEKKAPPDSRHRIKLAMNSLLIRTAGQWVLVETGAGDKLDAKRRDIFGIGAETRLPQRLAERGLRPEDISLVINTHLHFDHCGGNTRLLDGSAVPAFPNARYVVQRGELDWARHPSARDAATYLPENFEPIAAAGKWWLLDGDTEVLPGIELLVVPGHNRDMQCVRLTGGGRTAFLFVDLVPTTAHLPLHWIMAYDLYPMLTLENKRKWLAEAARHRWLCLFSHDVHTPAAYLREVEGKYELEPVAVD
jgi:glyoxylase-like metal-dependent hydrolase (beta-lactamase superfamily II)